MLRMFETTASGECVMHCLDALLAMSFCSNNYTQLLVDLLRTSLSRPPLIYSLSPGLLLSPHNVMVSLPAILSPALLMEIIRT